VRHIRRHGPKTRITIRRAGHYGRPEVTDRCEASGVDYVLGLPTNAVLRADPVIVSAAYACATRRRSYITLRCVTMLKPATGGKSWTCQRRVDARIEVSTLGMDIRYVFTSVTQGSAEHIYPTRD
jgi:hypothetical protein